MQIHITPLVAGDHPAITQTWTLRNTARAVDAPGFMPLCRERLHGELTIAPETSGMNTW